MGHRKFVSQVIHGARGGEEGGERGRKQLKCQGPLPLSTFCSCKFWARLDSKPGSSQPNREETTIAEPAAGSTCGSRREFGGRSGSGRESTHPTCKVNTLGGPSPSPSGGRAALTAAPAVTEAWGNLAALTPGCDSPREVGEEEAVALGSPRGSLSLPRAHWKNQVGRLPPAGPCSPDPCHSGFSSSGQRLQTCRPADS